MPLTEFKLCGDDHRLSDGEQRLQTAVLHDVRRLPAELGPAAHRSIVLHLAGIVHPAHTLLTFNPLQTVDVCSKWTESSSTYMDQMFYL